ncbi:MAG TPA: TRAP transporter small permease [Syntrophales bacterium]|nr:TRAP transporter small permease [Syntrophales bacterium]
MKKVYEHLEEAIGVLLLAIMALLAFANVVTRYFVQFSFAFTEEVEVAFLVWLTMLGTAAGFRRGVHLGFGLLALRFPALGRKVLAPIAIGLTIATFAVLFYYSFFQIRDEMALRITSEALGIPQWWYTLALPVGAVLVSLRVIEAGWKEYKLRQD